MKLVVHPAAQRELDDALGWSKGAFGDRAAAGLRRRFEQVGQLLMQQPAIGTPVAGQVRKLRLGRFPYSLVYRLNAEDITVIAVAHQSRLPGHWVGR